MRRLTQRGMLLALISAVILSGLLSFIIAKNVDRFSASVHDAEQHDFHAWVHANLEITSEQEKALQPIEIQFETKRKKLEDRILEEGAVVAHSMEAEDADIGSFETALSDLNAAQGELQKLTMTHFLDMKRHLSPDQSEKLLRWVHDSIGHDHEH